MTQIQMQNEIFENHAKRRYNVLLVDDDPGDIVLAKKALSKLDSNLAVHTAGDGLEAMQYLRSCVSQDVAPTTDRRARPDLVLLDLNMPRMDGRQALAEIKADENFRSIPVAIFTTSDADSDISVCYKLQASCYITKPVDLNDFATAFRSIYNFWFNLVKFPLN